MDARDEACMRTALAEAEKAFSESEVPVGKARRLAAERMYAVCNAGTLPDVCGCFAHEPARALCFRCR